MLYLAPVWYSVQFTKQLLENGNDVEVAAVSDQTVQILSSLMKMTWNMSVLRPSLLRPKFESIKEIISAFGKVVSTMEPSDIIFTNMAMNIIVYEESSCEVHLLEGISERGYEAALEATVSHSDTSVVKSTTVKKKEFNLWTISFTPDKKEEHNIKVQIGSISASQMFTVKTRDTIIYSPIHIWRFNKPLDVN